MQAIASRDPSNYYDAKATLYRDLATITATIFGFLIVALSLGGPIDTNYRSPNFVATQHWVLFYPSLGVGVVLLFFLQRMVHWERMIIRHYEP